MSKKKITLLTVIALSLLLALCAGFYYSYSISLKEKGSKELALKIVKKTQEINDYPTFIKNLNSIKDDLDNDVWNFFNNPQSLRGLEQTINSLGYKNKVLINETKLASKSKESFSYEIRTTETTELVKQGERETREGVYFVDVQLKSKRYIVTSFRVWDELEETTNEEL